LPDVAPGETTREPNRRKNLRTLGQGYTNRQKKNLSLGVPDQGGQGGRWNGEPCT